MSTAARSGLSLSLAKGLDFRAVSLELRVLGVGEESESGRLGQEPRNPCYAITPQGSPALEAWMRRKAGKQSFEADVDELGCCGSRDLPAVFPSLPARAALEAAARTGVLQPPSPGRLRRSIPPWVWLILRIRSLTLKPPPAPARAPGPLHQWAPRATETGRERRPGEGSEVGPRRKGRCCRLVRVACTAEAKTANCRKGVLQARAFRPPAHPKRAPTLTSPAHATIAEGTESTSQQNEGPVSLGQPPQTSTWPLHSSIDLLSCRFRRHACRLQNHNLAGEDDATTYVHTTCM